MASPQVENGHTRIANEILDILMKLVIPPNQRQVLDCIMRKTWGFQKKVDRIANSQIAEATGLLPQNVSRCLKALEAQSIIFRKKQEVGIQKDWERWKVIRTDNSEAKLISSDNSPEVINADTSVISTDYKKQSVLITTKEKKETPQKKGYGEFQNVLLTDGEYQKLEDRLGILRRDHLIERLSAYMRSKGKRYRDHYATILNWQRRDDAENKDSRSLPKTYTPTRDYGD